MRMNAVKVILGLVILIFSGLGHSSTCEVSYLRLISSVIAENPNAFEVSPKSDSQDWSPGSDFKYFLNLVNNSSEIDHLLSFEYKQHSGILTFTIRSKDYFGRRLHPDISGKNLFEHMFIVLKENGITPTAVQTRWSEGSLLFDNLNAINELTRNLDRPYRDPRQEVQRILTQEYRRPKDQDHPSRLPWSLEMLAVRGYHFYEVVHTEGPPGNFSSVTTNVYRRR